MDLEAPNSDPPLVLHDVVLAPSLVDPIAF